MFQRNQDETIRKDGGGIGWISESYSKSYHFPKLTLRPCQEAGLQKESSLPIINFQVLRLVSGRVIPLSTPFISGLFHPNHRVRLYLEAFHREPPGVFPRRPGIFSAPPKKPRLARAVPPALQQQHLGYHDSWWAFASSQHPTVSSSICGCTWGMKSFQQKIGSQICVWFFVAFLKFSEPFSWDANV